MRGSSFDELEFFRAVHASGARALLIDRRALVLLGIPLLTADYDFWIHADDAASFNACAAPFDLLPTHSPEEARARGRYVLQNDERVDVLVARAVPTRDGQRVVFEDIWQRRLEVPLAAGVAVHIPALDDLIATKRIAGRPKDLEDMRFLELLRQSEG